MLGCANVSSEAECEQYGGAYAPGQTCVATGESDQDMGIYGRCDGFSGFALIVTDLSGSSHSVAPSTAQPGDRVTYTHRVVNQGTGIAHFEVVETLPDGVDLVSGSVSASGGAHRIDMRDGIAHLVWTGCIRPYGGSLTLVHDGVIDSDVAPMTTLVSHAELRDFSTEDLRRLSSSIAVEAPPEPAHYTWEFTITPTGVSSVIVPLPEEIAGDLRNLGARRLHHLGGELPPFLEMGETNWTVSGMVISPGFLPFLPSITSTATYAALSESVDLLATVGVTIHVTKAPTGGLPGMPRMPGMPGTPSSPEPDRDYDTVPDNLDACPDVPGDPADPLFPGCPKTEEDETYYEEEPDADGDGIPDIYDLCPHEPGPWSEDTPGCPE